MLEKGARLLASNLGGLEVLDYTLDEHVLILYLKRYRARWYWIWCDMGDTFGRRLDINGYVDCSYHRLDGTIVKAIMGQHPTGQ